jgi:predicted ATPase
LRYTHGLARKFAGGIIDTHTRDLHSKIRLDGFLSFAPGSNALELQPLNVLIGVNASGKSNLIEAFELLRAMPTNLVDAIREGGGAAEWIWKGEGATRSAEIEVEVKVRAGKRPLRHRLAFTAVSHCVEVSDEAIEELEPAEGKVSFLYRFRQGHPVVHSRSGSENGGGRKYVRRNLPPDSLNLDQSILSQLKEHYSEITEMGVRYGAIQNFREWTFGRSAALTSAGGSSGRSAPARCSQPRAGAQSHRAQRRTPIQRDPEAFFPLISTHVHEG